jgi:hypothetical protein
MKWEAQSLLNAKESEFKSLFGENLEELKAQLVNDKKMCLELMHSPL